MNFGLRKVLERVSARKALVELSPKDVAGLLQCTGCDDTLDFNDGGYAEAGIAIQDLAKKIEDYHEHHKMVTKDMIQLTAAMKELGKAVNLERYKLPDDAKGIPYSVLNAVVDKRDVIFDMLDKQTNYVSIFDIEPDEKKTALAVAGFSVGLRDIAKKFQIGPYAREEYDSERDYLVDWLLENKDESWMPVISVTQQRKMEIE